MERFLEGIDNFNIDKIFNYSECFITSRLDIKPIFRTGIKGQLCYYEGMVLGDIFQTPIFKFEKGIYDISIQCTTTPLSGEVSFYLNNNIFGILDFYSPLVQETTLLIEGLVVTDFLQQAIVFEVTRKSTDSLGYNLMIGDFKISKRK